MYGYGIWLFLWYININIIYIICKKYSCQTTKDSIWIYSISDQLLLTAQRYLLHNEDVSQSVYAGLAYWNVVAGMKQPSFLSFESAKHWKSCRSLAQDTMYFISTERNKETVVSAGIRSQWGSIRDTQFLGLRYRSTISTTEAILWLSIQCAKCHYSISVFRVSKCKSEAQ